VDGEFTVTPSLLTTTPRLFPYVMIPGAATAVRVNGIAAGNEKIGPAVEEQQVKREVASGADC